MRGYAPFSALLGQYNDLEGSVRDTYGRVCWSHKIQECQADIYLSRYKFWEIIRIIGTAILSGEVFALFIFNELWVKWLTAGTSLLITCITGYFKISDLPQVINSHKQTAHKLLKVRDSLGLILLSIKMKSNSPREIQKLYEEIVEALDDIYLDAPQTTKKAVKAASKAIKNDKDNDITDEEIDLNLPKTLRKLQ